MNFSKPLECKAHSKRGKIISANATQGISFYFGPHVALKLNATLKQHQLTTALIFKLGLRLCQYVLTKVISRQMC